MLTLADEEAAVVAAPAQGEVFAVQLELVFDVNSSFLGPSAISALRGLVAGLPKGVPLQVALQAAVSDDGVKGAKPRDAERYNRWLAERRVDRVAVWLRQQARSELAIEPGFVAHDSSRRVTISARQAP
jgi:hypothetical protein